MLKRTLTVLDQTYGPHKSYKYTYMPDPRKLAPIETTQRSEIVPQSIRPPTSYVPNHETFLERADIHRLRPTSDFKASFKDWNDLFTCDKRQLRVRGIPRMSRDAIRTAVQAFQNGNPPERFDTKEEWLYYKQFKTVDYSYRVIPELPEKYRPHQSGIDQAPLPDYREINKMPQWAECEERRQSKKTV
ncbi:hypothetical protein, conserved [Trypanosoma brucei gambiense DAL972]|uniref:Small ribosomal subunit protein mS41 n=1 Tax=Trypanosoma brucei gambiense (strain MHOM/CI/86/DAL972) TaxID=679716 RepID=D0A4R9_TRYB9|nr:hypothetical protein, conserved [Trypanosoma brucei gambiense DAL972]CBH16263.1 hypothetical protein, conserved [Trypanosoma brucei gambiense DAL972]|eukprot:XP_011778527.1 hypothetical protein, conserved [Trypanosoma brucei gambiense DAL972]